MNHLKLSLLLTLVVVATAGCVGIIDGGDGTSPETTTDLPTTVPETATPTPSPAVSPERKQELDRWTAQVEAMSIGEGEWEYINESVIKFRMTPDFDQRDQVGVGTDAFPEAVAKEMYFDKSIAPDKVIIEVVTEDDGAYLGHVNVTEVVAVEYAELRASPDDLATAVANRGNITDRWVEDYDTSPILWYHISHLEVRHAYLIETLERGVQRSSDLESQFISMGLYNKSIEFPDHDIGIRGNATVFVRVAIPPGEKTDVTSTLSDIWAELQNESYYSYENASVNLQFQVYNASTGKFDYAENVPSSLARAYAYDEISQLTFRLAPIRQFSIHDADLLPGVPEKLPQKSNETAD